MRLTPKHAAELEQLLGRFAAIQAEPTPAAVCGSCGQPWAFTIGKPICCMDPVIHYPTDTRFARQVELMPAALAIVAEANELAQEEERHKFLAQVAASLLPWDSAGDEAAATLAVRAARQLLTAAERDGAPLQAPS